MLSFLLRKRKIIFCLPFRNSDIDVRINMKSEDEEPLLQPNSSCSQSRTKSFELKIHETNLDLEDSHPAGVSADDKDSLHDLDTDGPSGINFSGRIRFDRQWSYPFDEKNKRDYHEVMQKDQPLTVIDQVSKDDVSVEYRESKFFSSPDSEIF